MNACRIFSKALILLLAFPFFVHAQETQYVALAFGTVSQATVQSANFGYNYNYGTTYTLCSVNSPAPFTVEYVNDQVSYGGDFIAYILFNATTMGTYSGDIYLYYSSLLSGYKPNRISWLELSSNSDWESNASNTCKMGTFSRLVMLKICRIW